jgi:hypothetical protein
VSSLEPETNLPRQITHALEDDCSQPLKELKERAPEEEFRFSAFEARIGEWSFGYGVAWALARVRDPFLSSEKVAAVAEAAAREAWRSYTGYEFWGAIMAEGRAQRGSLEGAPGTQLDAFMQRLGAMRTRHPAAEPERAPPSSQGEPAEGY